MSFREKLIENVKNYPCLYDMQHPDYNNNNARDEAWIDIENAVNYKPYFEDFIPDEFMPPNETSDIPCKLAWTRIFGRFWGEMQSFSAGGGEEPEKYLYLNKDSMKFFKPFVPTKRASCSHDHAQLNRFANYFDQLGEDDIQNETKLSLTNVESKELDIYKNK